MIGDRLQQSLNLIHGNHALIVIDENEQQYMFLRIFLLHRRRKQIVFCIIVDHGLGQDAVLGLRAYCRTQLAVHKSQHLIHIQINIRNVF